MSDEYLIFDAQFFPTYLLRYENSFKKAFEKHFLLSGWSEIVTMLLFRFKCIHFFNLMKRLEIKC